LQCKSRDSCSCKRSTCGQVFSWSATATTSLVACCLLPAAMLLFIFQRRNSVAIQTSCFLFFGPPLIAICNNMLLNNFRIFSCLILFIFVAFLVCNSSICLLFAASFCCLHFNVSLGTLRKYLPFYCEYLYRHGSQPRILMFN